MRRELGAIGCIAALLVGGMGFTKPAYAASLTVNTTADTVDKAPGNGVCADATNKCSLRAAIMEANATAAADTITVPAGTYKLTIAGTGEDASAKGDLDITSGTLTINGANATTTIIDGSAKDRIFDLSNKAVVSLSKLTLTNGKGGTTQEEGGGAIRATGGAALSLTTVTVQNSTSGFFGGGILFNHAYFSRPIPAKLTITSSIIKSNTADRNGGGITLGGGSTLELKTTQMVSNVARGLDDSQLTQYGGGAVFMVSGFTPISGGPMPTKATFTDGTFDKNEARGQFAGAGWGGAIFSDSFTSIAITGGNFTNNLSYSDGGAINSQDILSIRSAAFTTNEARGSGGALYASGSSSAKTILQSKFARNKASLDSGNGGGGIDMYGPFTMRNIALRANTAQIGGGIRLRSSLGTMQYMIIEDNIAGSDGGGVAVAPGDVGKVTSLIDSTVQRNKAQLNGGGVFNAGEMALSNLIVTGNTATEGRGGGLYNYQSYGFSVANSTVTNNKAGLAGGGVYSRHTTFGSNGAMPKTPVLNTVTISGNSAEQGGGVANDLSLRIVSSSIISNTAVYGGGIFNAQRSSASDYPRSLDLNNVTVSANTASDSGGGIYGSMGAAYINSSTIANNSVKVGTTPAGNGGGIFNDPASAPVVTISNIIVANNTAATGPDCNGSVKSADYNLIRTLTGCTFTGTTTHNKTGNPVLGPLKNNGGTTLTMAIPTTSPARNAGSPQAFGSSTTACPKADQRGATRIAPCDMGAYENAPMP